LPYPLVSQMSLPAPNVFIVIVPIPRAFASGRISSVCRTVLTSRSRYCKEMASLEDSEGARLAPAELVKLRSVLPGKFWVTEVSLPDLYTANRHKIGDVIIDAAASRKEHRTSASLAFAWLPGIARYGQGLANMIPSWSLKGHIPLLRHTEGPVPALEW
jgi:hypothetical protein